jgi:hypothetical protein
MGDSRSSLKVMCFIIYFTIKSYALLKLSSLELKKVRNLPIENSRSQTPFTPSACPVGPTREMPTSFMDAPLILFYINVSILY